MPGIFSKSARPVRPGAYFDWNSAPQVTVLPNTGSIVAVPVTHDWGPANTAVLTTSFADFQSKYGPSTTTAAYRAVKGAFKGEGLVGRGGAGAVLVYRMAGSAAVAATRTLNNTAGSPAPALTLTAKYPGTYGNNLQVTVQVNALDGTKNDLVVSLSGTVLETYTHLATDIAALAAAINASSQWVNATSLVTGTALGTVSLSALATGNDGATLVGSDYTAMLGQLAPRSFGLFAPFDIASTTSWSDSTGSAILTSIISWQATMNTNGKRFMTVIGGSTADTGTTSAARSATINDPNVVNLGIGGVVDAELGTLSTSQLAPRIAGILAARGESKSLTYARLKDVTSYNFPADSSILQAFNGGVVVLALDSDPDAPVHVEKALTTYIGGDSSRPYLIYRNPKFVRTMHGIDTELTQWAASNAIGNLQVNPNSRAFLVGHAREAIQSRVDLGVVQPGFTVAIDPNPPPSDLDEFIGLIYGVAFGRSVEQIFNLVNIS